MADTPGMAAPRSVPMHWSVPVLDTHDRRHELMVVVSRGQVVLLPPPGEALILPAASDEQVFVAIRDARRVARELGDRSP